MKKSRLVAFLLCIMSGSVIRSQSVSLSSPKGGEKWIAGIAQNITWAAPGLATAVKLVLFKGGTAAANKVGNIAQNLSASAGSYSWNVGSYEGGTAAEGTDYYIRIITMDGQYKNENKGPFAISGLPISNLPFKFKNPTRLRSYTPGPLKTAKPDLSVAILSGKIGGGKMPGAAVFTFQFKLISNRVPLPPIGANDICYRVLIILRDGKSMEFNIQWKPDWITELNAVGEMPLEVSVPVDWKTVIISVDPQNRIAETEESNNSAEVTI